MENIVYGRNPVIEALSAKRSIEKIIIQDGIRHTQIAKIISMAKEKKIPFQYAVKKKLDVICEGENHQGVAAYTAAYSYSTIEDILNHAKRQGKPPFIIIAEGLTDPHNLGSIIRTANAAGADGVIIPKNRSVSLNSTVAKVSAGAVEYLPVAKVSNISSTIRELKSEGLWIVGTDLSATQLHTECDLTGAIGIVIGNEGKGLSRIVKDNCDFLVKIPMIGEIQSLNASVAAGILMYEVVRQRY